MIKLKQFLQIFLPLLLPLSYLYGLLMSLRAICYKKEIFKRHKSSLFIISIGKLTVGGTGKTPLVIYLAKLLKNKKFNPVIISRGYRGKADSDVNVVSDGKTVILDAIQAGDEPRLIAESLQGVPVLTGVKRPLPCKYAEKNLSVDMVVLDDGFQHLPLQRNLNIILFNGSSLKHCLRVFPAGELREPIKALNRADLIVFTSVTAANQVHIDNFLARLNERGISLPHISFSKGHLSFFSHDKQQNNMDSHHLRNKKLHAFSGIANSNRFIDSLKQLNISVEFFKQFRDHHTYTHDDIQSLVDNAIQSDADGLVTTEKDYVKLKKFNFKIPLFISRINPDQNHEFEQFILSRIPKKQ